MLPVGINEALSYARALMKKADLEADRMHGLRALAEDLSNLSCTAGLRERAKAAATLYTDE